ncbi:MAG: hypothetical protein R3200_12570 [Xanthomonadales bacterium]|nr:hypothetical protein [Xanthomonadales bacterium]
MALRLFLKHMNELGVGEEEEPTGIVRAASGTTDAFEVFNPRGKLLGSVDLRTGRVKIHDVLK